MQCACQKFCRFLPLAPHTSETSGIFLKSRVRHPHINRFATEIVETHCIVNEIIVGPTFYVLRKQSRFRLAWSRLWTDPGETEPASVFHATTDPCIDIYDPTQLNSTGQLS